MDKDEHGRPTVFLAALEGKSEKTRALLEEYGAVCFDESPHLLFIVADRCDDETFRCVLEHAPDGYFGTKKGKKELEWISSYCSAERVAALPRVNLKAAKRAARTNILRAHAAEFVPPENAKRMQWNLLNTLVPSTYLLVSPDGPFSLETKAGEAPTEWTDSDANGHLRLVVPGSHCFGTDGSEFYRCGTSTGMFSVFDIAGLHGAPRPSHLWVGQICDAPRVDIAKDANS